MSALTYRREIDGLRTLAVGAVVMFHAGTPGFDGGHLGVDVFFVISGYLITAILLDDLARDRFSLPAVYERRARRILPALAFMVACVAAAAPALLKPEALVQFGQSVAATALFVANIFFWWTTDYFGGAAAEKPLLHMWSLAVEEQFYLAFPPALWLLWRGRRRAGLVPAVALLAALSLGLAEAMSRTHPTAAFYWPFGRAWELLAGALVALRLRGRVPDASAAASFLALAGLALVLGSIALPGAEAHGPGLSTVPVVAGTALLIRYARADGIVGGFLALGPMVFLGQLSYSIYLWHQPLFAFARISSLGDPPLRMFLLLSLLTVPLAWVSWRFVERPFRARAGVGRRAIFAFSVLSIGAMTAGGALVARVPGVAETLSWTSRLDPEQQARAAEIARLGPDNARITAASDLAQDQGCVLQFETPPPGLAERMQACARIHGPGVLTTGGSHGYDLFAMLARHGDAPFLIGISRGWCRAHRRLEGPPPHPCPQDAIARLVAAHPQLLRLVIYTQAAHPMFGAGRDLRGPDAGFHPDLADEVAAWAAGVARSTPVLVLGPQRMLGVDPRKLDPRRDFATQLARRQDPGIAAAEDRMSAALAAACRRAGLPFLSKAELMAQDLPGEGMRGDRLTFRDQDHLSLAGIDLFGPRLVRGLARHGYSEPFLARSD